MILQPYRHFAHCRGQGVWKKCFSLLPTFFSIRECIFWWVSGCSSTYSSDMSSASNSLAREFLTDVNRLCNAVVQRAEAKEDEEEETHMAALGQYLVQGRGFILLTTLNSTIDQVRISLTWLKFWYWALTVLKGFVWLKFSLVLVSLPFYGRVREWIVKTRSSKGYVAVAFCLQQEQKK